MTYAYTPRLILNDSPAIIKHKSCVLPPIFMFDYLVTLIFTLTNMLKDTHTYTLTDTHAETLMHKLA